MGGAARGQGQSLFTSFETRIISSETRICLDDIKMQSAYVKIASVFSQLGEDRNENITNKLKMNYDQRGNYCIKNHKYAFASKSNADQFMANTTIVLQDNDFDIPLSGVRQEDAARRRGA